MSKKDPIKRSYNRVHRKESAGSFEVGLFYCEEENPPTRKTPSVKELCTIKCTLNIPYNSLPDFTTARGEVCKRLLYDVEMVPSRASLEFTVFVDGRKQGSQNANVRF